MKLQRSSRRRDRREQLRLLLSVADSYEAEAVTPDSDSRVSQGQVETISMQTHPDAIKVSGPSATPQPRSDHRSRLTRITLEIMTAAAAAAIILTTGVATIVSRDPGGGSQPGAAPSEPAPVPAGYKTYQGDGLSIGVPSGWTPGETRDGVVDVREPGSSRFLRLITVDGSSNALEELTDAERQFAAKDVYQPYRKIGLGTVDYRGYDAAEWEFTFTLNGVVRHVVYRGVVSGGRSYGVYFSVPETLWEQSRAILQTAVDTFHPTD